jgi:hypothetical protein
MNSDREDGSDAPDEDMERARINSETAKIAWTDLQRFFAKGRAVCVYPALDLVDVAYQVSVDNKEKVESWMESGRLGPVSDAQAREWLEANALMWAVVVKPWVLVQPILKDPDMGKRNDLN